jgi:hypothetical protein
MNDLDNEDSKKDTLVDVVFKKALKEFRQNIFSFYSSALAVSETMLGDIEVQHMNNLIMLYKILQWPCSSREFSSSLLSF